MKKEEKEKRDKLVSASRGALIKNRHEVARALEILFASGYISRHRLYWENFVRGMFFTMGGIIGATFAIGILLWLLSLFDQIPFIGPIVDGISEQIKSAQH